MRFSHVKAQLAYGGEFLSCGMRNGIQAVVRDGACDM
jgi:hypothetical protein